jgi:hypothetical protein
MLSRDTGHKRVPAPPHMTTGIKRRPLIVPAAWLWNGSS